MKKIISLFLMCCIVLTVICQNLDRVEAKTKNRHYYVNSYGDGRTIRIKNGKLTVTGKFFDMELKEAWKYPVTMKKRRFSISKNVKYEEETGERYGKISQKNFLKNNKKYYTVGFEVKNGKVVMMYCSDFEPQLS